MLSDSRIFCNAFGNTFFASSNEDSSFKGGCITLILGVSFCIGGILIREYSESSEKRKDFLKFWKMGIKIA